MLSIQTLVPRLPIAQRRLIPIERFPVSMGQWTVQTYQQMDPDVVKQCPTAHFVERIYSNTAGYSLQLLLMTATGADDIHDPNICFPSQGWVVESQTIETLAGQPVTFMRAQQDDTQLQTVYWYTGYYQPRLPANREVRAISALRTHMTGTMEGMSLFVRIMAPADTPQPVLEDFTKRAVSQVNLLVGPQSS